MTSPTSLTELDQAEHEPIDLDTFDAMLGATRLPSAPRAPTRVVHRGRPNLFIVGAAALCALVVVFAGVAFGEHASLAHTQAELRSEQGRTVALQGQLSVATAHAAVCSAATTAGEQVVGLFEQFGRDISTFLAAANSGDTATSDKVGAAIQSLTSQIGAAEQTFTAAEARCGVVPSAPTTSSSQSTQPTAA